MLKLLAAPDPAPCVAAMRATGVLGQVLAGADDRALAPLIHLETQTSAAPDAIRRLAALGGVELADAMRLSRAQTARLAQLREAATSMMMAGELGYRLKQNPARDALLLRCALLEQPWEDAAMKLAKAGAKAQFPMRAKDLMPEFLGPELGAKLAKLEADWIASGFALTRSELLSRTKGRG